MRVMVLKFTTLLLFFTGKRQNWTQAAKKYSWRTVPEVLNAFFDKVMTELETFDARCIKPELNHQKETGTQREKSLSCPIE